MRISWITRTPLRQLVNAKKEACTRNYTSAHSSLFCLLQVWLLLCQTRASLFFNAHHNLCTGFNSFSTFLFSTCFKSMASNPSKGQEQWRITSNMIEQPEMHEELNNVLCKTNVAQLAWKLRLCKHKRRCLFCIIFSFCLHLVSFSNSVKAVPFVLPNAIRNAMEKLSEYNDGQFFLSAFTWIERFRQHVLWWTV